ncbi:MAG: DUF5658 family protein [Planctomycetota bacterium]
MATTADNQNQSVQGWLRSPLALSGTPYVWVIVGATLDVLLTGVVLAVGGREVNPIAHAVLAAHGFTGMVIFKYVAVFCVLLGCEFVTRYNPRTGRRLCAALIAIHFAPVVWSTGLLINHFF